MEDEKLQGALRTMVRQYGLKRVQGALREIGGSILAHKKDELRSTHVVHKANGTLAPRPRTTAPAYVSKLEVPKEMQVPLMELAQRFEEKTFLPTFGDIRNFCLIYGIGLPASPSRISAIPRIFTHLSERPPEEVHSMLQTNSFSGPSRLAPIAEAIRRRSRRERRVKRDPELLRAILFEMERSHSSIVAVTLDDSLERVHHFRLLCDEGLLEETRESCFRITASGYDFLDAIRDDSRWQKVMGRIEENGGAWTLDILKQLASQFLKDALLR